LGSTCAIWSIRVGGVSGYPPKGGHNFEISHCIGGFTGSSTTFILKPCRSSILLTPTSHQYNYIILKKLFQYFKLHDKQS